MSNTSTTVSITVLLQAGRLSLEMMKATHTLAAQYDFDIYFSLMQNMRLINVPKDAVDNIKKELANLGADFKGPGKFPVPRICVGKPHCDLGIIDTKVISDKISNCFSKREKTKAKLKISIAGCSVGCAGTKTTDISIMATRKGYNIYAGGKAGPNPKVARRIKLKVTEAEVLDTIEKLVDFHDQKTKTKMRMYKLLDDPQFPFPEV